VAATTPLSELAQNTKGAQDAVLLATKYTQGGRTHYSLQLPLEQIINFLPKPDPDKPFEGNRAVDRTHATKFGSYVRENVNWVSPAIMVRAGENAVLEDGLSADVGVQRIRLVHVTLPKKLTDQIAALLILDGQHRVFGIYDAYVAVLEELGQKEQAIRNAEKHEQEPEVLQDLYSQRESLVEQRDRFLNECISVDIAVVQNGRAHQMFVDIADNAKGISRDFRVVLDQRQVINRIATRLTKEHELLKGRVWDGHQKSELPYKSEFLWGAKAVADAVRASFVGSSGRIGKGVEDHLANREEDSTIKAAMFFDDLLASSLPLSKVVYGGLEAWRLRERVSKDPLVLGEEFTMMYSGPAIRVLAGVWKELTAPSPPKKGQTEAKPMDRDDVIAFLRKIDSLMQLDGPLTGNSVWVRGCPPAFAVGGTAPISRAGTIRQFERTLIDWARKGLPAYAEEGLGDLSTRIDEIMRFRRGR
jgi:hypothetical protein